MRHHRNAFKGIEGLIWGLAAVTMLFSAVYIYGMLPTWVPIRWAFAGAIAFLLTRAWHLLYKYKLRSQMPNDWLLWIPIVAISATTVWGTVSTFHEQVVRNTLESQEYQNLQQQRVALQTKFDRQVQINHLTRSSATSVEIAQIDAKMERLRQLGGGAKNALYAELATVTGWSISAIALTRLIFFAVLIDLVILILIKISQSFYGLSLKNGIVFLSPGGGLNAMPVSSSRRPSENGTRLMTRFVNVADPRPFLKQANAKIQENKYKRMQRLEDFLKENPNASLSQMADAIGVASRETARRYLRELRAE